MVETPKKAFYQLGAMLSLPISRRHSQTSVTSLDPYQQEHIQTINSLAATMMSDHSHRHSSPSLAPSRAHSPQYANHRPYSHSIFGNLHLFHGARHEPNVHIKVDADIESVLAEQRQHVGGVSMTRRLAFGFPEERSGHPKRRRRLCVKIPTSLALKLLAVLVTFLLVAIIMRYRVSERALDQKLCEKYWANSTSAKRRLCRKAFG